MEGLEKGVIIIKAVQIQIYHPKCLLELRYFSRFYKDSTVCLSMREERSREERVGELRRGEDRTGQDKRGNK